MVYAPGRSGRPGAWLPEVEPVTEQELESCPFCAGREDRTPPQTLVLGDPWRVRVVPNLYPAFERQEVVIHTPEHIRSFAELDDDQIELVAEAWEQRRASEPDGFRGDQYPLRIEAMEDVIESFSFLADAVLYRNLVSVNKDLIGIDRLAAQFLDLPNFDPASIDIGVE